MLSDNWKAAYNAARNVVNPKKISEQMCSGGVGAAIVTKKETFIQEYALIPIVPLVCVPKGMHSQP